MEPIANFSEMFEPKQFVDSAEGSDERVDVVMPLLHSNELFRNNLLSIYSQIPVARLIVGNAGVIDDSLQILAEFPRVEVQDHTFIKTLGRSLALLIESVSTENFVYVHSDVELPEGWYQPMVSALGNFGWVGSRMEVIVLQHFSNDLTGKRPLAGAQLGRKDAFNGIASSIEDDFVYRQEDFVLAEIVQRNGFAVGNADTFHWHQQMPRKTMGTSNKVVGIDIRTQESGQEVNRVLETQSFGFIKYCKPNSNEVIDQFIGSANALVSQRASSLGKLLRLAEETNPSWIPIILGLSGEGKRPQRALLIMRQIVGRLLRNFGIR